MNKQKINMVGGGFQHDICSSAGNVPKSIEWVKGVHSAPISIHLDAAMFNIPTDKTKKNYGWLQESRSIIPQVYQRCIDNLPFIEENFEMIFTHDMRLVSLSDKIVYLKWKAKPWINNYGVHPKSKLVSMIASSKVMCEQHRFRQQMIQKFSGQVDHFGRGFRYIATKEEGLNDYYFSIAMENHTYSNSYSEKITDCFATGTIPIYYGTPDIGEIFNSDGIITLNENFMVEDLSPELYYSKIDAVRENFDLVRDMPIAEDYIYNNFIKNT
jgi:hypothetical protein